MNERNKKEGMNTIAGSDLNQPIFIIFGTPYPKNSWPEKL